MKHILVPTDFSENAYKALIYATKLFEKNPCTIHILHSIEAQASKLTSRVDIGKSEKVMDNLYDEADKKCEEVRQQLIKDTAGGLHKFDIISTAMSLPRAMNRICVQRDVDLVIMGTKGQTGAKEVFLGSNTENVIKRIKKIPVLAIPLQAEFSPLSKIAFATSFQRSFSPSNLNELIFLARLHKSNVEVLYVREGESLSSEQRENMDILLKHLSDIQVKVVWLEDESEKTKAIVDYIEREQVDMLSLIYYKHNIIKRLFRESVVKKIGRNPATPYLVIPASR